MGTLEERLKGCHLTKAHRRIAEFCLQNKQSIPLLSSAEIARQVGVSDVSVIRFSKALGYDSFIDFKHDVQREIANISLNSATPSPIVRYVSSRTERTEDAGAEEDAQTAYMQIVQDILCKNSKAVFDQSAKMILTCRNKYVLGIRFRNSVAEICANLLRMTTPNIFQIPAADYAAFQFAMDFTQDDCLIWFCFGRYTNFEKQMLEFIRRSGIRLIVISDERASRVALEADLFIQSYGHATMPFYSSVGNCIIAEQIAHAVIGMGWIGAEKRLRDYETGLGTTVVQEDP